MCGLPQAGNIANKQLQEHSAKYGFFPVTHTPGLWHHTTRNIFFTTVVQDIGIKYNAKNKDDNQHLLAALKDKNTITDIWGGFLYCRLTLKWNHNRRYMEILMQGYVKETLHKFQHLLSS